MSSELVLIVSTGAWEFADWQILGETQEPPEAGIAPSITESVFPEADFHEALGKVSRKLESPIGENIRSTVRALKGK